MSKRLKQVLGRTPLGRYLAAVEQGTREQSARAERLRQGAEKVTKALHDYDDRNHFAPLVAEHLGGRKQ